MKYCTHCGAELLDEAVLCPKCGCLVNEEKSAAPVEVQQASRISVCALIGFIMSMVSIVFVFNIFGMISIAGVVLSSIGLSQINGGVKYRGKGFAIAGIVVSAVMFFVGLSFWMNVVGA